MGTYNDIIEILSLLRACMFQVLSQLLADARGYTRATVNKAVISVPAYFNEQQREATITAGRWVKGTNGGKRVLACSSILITNASRL